MFRFVARVVEPLWEWVWPSSGRHRRGDPPVVQVPAVSWPRVREETVLRGEDVALVRPYLTAHERRMDRKHRQAVLARAEYLLGVAACGADTGTRSCRARSG